MEILQFKTNINGKSCVFKASQEIDKIKNIKNWEVETAAQNKTLTIRGKQLDSKKIIRAVKKAGFKAEIWGQTQANR